MALTQQEFVNTRGGEIVGTIEFDDVTGAMSRVLVDNTAAVTSITAVFRDYTTRVVVWTRTIQAGTGRTPFDVSVLGQAMVKNAKGFWTFPYIVETN